MDELLEKWRTRDALYDSQIRGREWRPRSLTGDMAAAVVDWRTRELEDIYRGAAAAGILAELTASAEWLELQVRLRRFEDMIG